MIINLLLISIIRGDYMDTKALDILIDFIKKKNELINSNWKREKNYRTINMKKIKVIDIVNNDEYLDTIFEYRNYILGLYIELSSFG